MSRLRSRLAVGALLCALPMMANAQVSMPTSDPATGQQGRALVMVQRCEQSGQAVSCNSQGISPLGLNGTGYSYTSAASTNQTNVSAAPVTLLSAMLCNQASSLRYARIYNLATTPTSASTPVLRGSAASNGGCTTLFSNPTGVTLSAGLAFEITTGAPDNDAGATSANDTFLNLEYR